MRWRQKRKRLKRVRRSRLTIGRNYSGCSFDFPRQVSSASVKRLLRESGFVQVVVTGRSGDGGIDGYGTLQINSLVSFKVLFQCKRYANAVTPAQVRDCRGAMQGRADKGIVMTTGAFTAKARKEATRDGVPPIELVDGQKMLEMFTELELGLTPVKTYEIDQEFFKAFQ
jgi:restriction system protein